MTYVDKIVLNLVHKENAQLTEQVKDRDTIIRECHQVMTYQDSVIANLRVVNKEQSKTILTQDKENKQLKSTILAQENVIKLGKLIIITETIILITILIIK